MSDEPKAAAAAAEKTVDESPQAGDKAEEAPVTYGPITAEEALPKDWAPPTALFHSDIDETNDDIAALQALAFEESTPEDRADGYKDQGNEHFQKGRRGFRTALECYTKAIDEPNVNDPKRRSIYYSNRALLHLKMENNAKAQADAREAVKLDPSNLKAHHRGILGAMGRVKYEEAIAQCNDALELFPEHKTITKLLQQATEKLAAKRERDALREAKRLAEQMQRDKLEEEINKRGIVMGKPTYRSEKYEGEVAWDEDEGILTWPVVFLYPEHEQSDFLQCCAEDTTIDLNLSHVFEHPAPWDEDLKYRPGNLEVFFQTNATVPIGEEVNYKTRKWVKVDTSRTLLEILQMDGHVVPKMPTFHVIPLNCKDKGTYLPVD